MPGGCLSMPKFSIDYCGRLRLLLCSASRILKCPSSATIRWAFQLASHLKMLPDLKPNAYHMIFRHYQPLKRSSESLPYKIKQGRLVVKIHQKYQLQHPSKIIFWLQLRLDASHHFVKSWAHRSHGIGDQVLGDLRSKIPQGCQLEMFQDNRSPQRGKNKSNLMVGSDSRCWMNPQKKYQDLVLHVHLHDTLGYT